MPELKVYIQCENESGDSKLGTLEPPMEQLGENGPQSIHRWKQIQILDGKRWIIR